MIPIWWVWAAWWHFSPTARRVSHKWIWDRPRCPQSAPWIDASTRRHAREGQAVREDAPRATSDAWPHAPPHVCPARTRPWRSRPPWPPRRRESETWPACSARHTNMSSSRPNACLGIWRARSVQTRPPDACPVSLSVASVRPVFSSDALRSPRVRLWAPSRHGPPRRVRIDTRSRGFGSSCSDTSKQSWPCTRSSRSTLRLSLRLCLESNKWFC